MTLYQDVEVKYGQTSVSVFYQGEYIGEMAIIRRDHTRRWYVVGLDRYDRAHVAARELVRRVRNV